MRLNLEWFEGAPAQFEPGMYIETTGGVFCLIGHCDAAGASSLNGPDDRVDCRYPEVIKRWAWLVKPHELEWLEGMATSNAKSRPEQ